MRPIYITALLIALTAPLPLMAQAATASPSVPKELAGSKEESKRSTNVQDTAAQDTQSADSKKSSLVLIEFEGYKVSVSKNCLSAIYDSNDAVLKSDCGPSARFAAALYYIGEHDVDLGDKLAIDRPLKLLEAAAHEGYVPAVYYTGIIHYATKNYNDAYPFLEEAATHGVKEAMALVGILNLIDDLKEPDHVKGFAWLILAALNGQEMALKYMKLLDEHTSPEVTKAAFEEAKILLEKIKFNESMRSEKSCMKI